MRIRVLIPGALIVLAACGGGGDPAVPAGQQGGGPLEVVERAEDVAGQLDSREAELEQMVEDLGG